MTSPVLETSPVPEANTAQRRTVVDVQDPPLHPVGAQTSRARRVRVAPGQPRSVTWAERQVRLRDHRLRFGWTRRISVRLFDLVVALGGLVVLTPLLVIVGIMVAATSSGRPLYVQWRVGRFGRLFPCLKFRTMYRDAETRLAEMLLSDPELAAEWRRDHKLRNDPRTTAVGRVLRRTSLDELPQLINVALGQMSIVGPRPIVTAEAERYGDKLPAVLSVRPGLTGLWQVSGRNNTTYERRTELDLEYVRNQALWRDLLICARTARQVLSPHAYGAC